MKKILVAVLAVLVVGVVAGCDEVDSPAPADTSPSSVQDEKRDNPSDDKSSFGFYMNPNNGSVGYGYEPYSGGIPLG